MWGLKLIDINGLIFWVYPCEVRWTPNGFGFLNFLKLCVQAKGFLIFFCQTEAIYLQVG